MMEPPMIWSYAPPPQMRIPGYAGAAISIHATPSPTAMDVGLGAMGVDLRLMTPDYGAVYRRRPVGEDFAEQLRTFLWETAAEFTPEDSVEPFFDGFSGLSLSVVESTPFTVTLQVEVIVHEGEDSNEVDGINFETPRAALITAANQAEALAHRAEHSRPLWVADPCLPRDFFHSPGHRLTGILRTGHEVGGSSNLLCVMHHVRLDESAHGEVETSLLTSLLPFCTVAAHGVDEDRTAWVILIQVVPMDARTRIAAPWSALMVAREEVHHALWRCEGAEIIGETAATRAELVDLIESRGAARELIEDWGFDELVLAAVAELANAPLEQIAIGRLTGCAFPDVDHDCPRDVFACAFSRWQELLFAADAEDDDPWAD